MPQSSHTSEAPGEPRRILVVEDNREFGNVVVRALRGHGHRPQLVESAEAALEVLSEARFDLILADLYLPGMTGIELLKSIRRPDGPAFVVITGSADVATAVEATRAGATDYITKPVDNEYLLHVVRRATEHQAGSSDLDWLSDPDPHRTARSAAMRRTLDLAWRCARSRAGAALLLGESGVGKEVVASYIHRQSRRAQGPFVRINIAAVPDTMLEAHLFGSVRGAFTGASVDREGIFASAAGGTLLLDEIADAKPEIQAKLLRVIETHRFYPVGSVKERSADVRILAATNRNPNDAVASQQMRADLYYRLATMVIHIPPLRERREDIIPLARSIATRIAAEIGEPPLQFDEGARQMMEDYSWPGNVRELRNVIERLSVLSDQRTVTARTLKDLQVLGGESAGAPRAVVPSSRQGHDATVNAPPDTRTPTVNDAETSETAARRHAPRPLNDVVNEAVERVEREHIAAVLREVGGNRTRAAEALGISRSTLWGKIQRYGLD